MNKKLFLKLVGVLFVVIFIVHALRLFYGWEAEIGGTIIPLWVSYVALALSAGVIYFGFKFSKD